MLRFRSGKTKCLIATDIAARGLDISDIDLVVISISISISMQINYDYPHSIEDYVHRIGRTGRAGQKGMAVSLLKENDLHNKGKQELCEVTILPHSP